MGKGACVEIYHVLNVNGENEKEPLDKIRSYPAIYFFFFLRRVSLQCSFPSCSLRPCLVGRRRKEMGRKINVNPTQEIRNRNNLNIYSLFHFILLPFHSTLLFSTLPNGPFMQSTIAIYCNLDNIQQLSFCPLSIKHPKSCVRIQ